MIEIVTLAESDIVACRNGEDAYYWSGLAEILFRERGILSVRTSKEEVTSSARALIFTRGVGHNLASAGHPEAFRFYEGPLDPVTAQMLGISIEPFELPKLEISWLKTVNGSLFYPQEYFRDSGGQQVLANEPRAWHREAIRGQFLDAPGWETLAWARTADVAKPRVVAVAKGSVIACGIPLFDVAVRSAAFAPLPQRYEKKFTCSAIHGVLSGVVAAIERGGLAAGAEPSVKVRRWPVGKKTAFTIRHDFDRPVSLEFMENLLAFYEARGLKASIGFLDYLLPLDTIARVQTAGHEVQLHSHAANDEAFASTLSHLSDIAGEPIRGMTVHGGVSGPGFRGDTHFGWAEKEQLSYVELFSGPYGGFAPIPRLTHDLVPRTSPVIGIRYHFSFDRGRAETNCEAINARLPAALAAGEYIILMNHPDLHRAAFVEWLDQFDLQDLWLATQAEVAEWIATTHFSMEIDVAPTAINFGVELPHDVEVTWTWSNGTECLARGRGPWLDAPRESPLGTAAQGHLDDINAGFSARGVTQARVRIDAVHTQRLARPSSRGSVGAFMADDALARRLAEIQPIGNGLRTILDAISPPAPQRILEVVNHASGAAAGETTTRLLLERFHGSIEVLERKTATATIMASKFSNISIVPTSFPRHQNPGPFDIILMDLESALQRLQYTEFLNLAYYRLSENGLLINSIVIDFDVAFPNASSAARERHQRFLADVFGTFTFERAKQVLWEKGFEALALVDKWPGAPAAWLCLRKRPSEAAG